MNEYQTHTLYDLYCGTGTIGQIMARLSPSIQQVIGIDIVESAIDDARTNAAKLSDDISYEYHAGAVEKVFPTLSVPSDSMMIVDPPRAGLHAGAVEHLLAIKRQHPTIALCYVSCNPQTLGRDLQ
jgi:tRNA (uracil-5-)-methyltransferase